MRRAAEAPWGDGLVDEGFDCRSGPFDWTRVSHDELVFLSPALRASGLPRDAARARLLPLLGAARARRTGGVPGDDPRLAAHATAWIEASAALVEAGGPFPPADALAAVALSWETQVNAAYWLPQFELLQETLAAAAWLGILCGGRRALLPRVLGELLDPAASGEPQGGAWAPVAAYLRHRTLSAGVARPLARAVASLRAGAPAALVKPGRRPSPPPALPELLAAALAARPEERPGMPGSVALPGPA